MRIIVLAAWLAMACGVAQASAQPSPPQSPIDGNGRLMMRRGDQAVIGFDQNMHIVLKKIENIGPDGPPVGQHKPAADEVVLYLGQDKTSGSFLRVENGSAQNLHYKAVIVVPRSGDLDFVPTSICPVKAHVFSLETWPNDVIGVIVGPFAVVSPQENACTQ